MIKRSSRVLFPLTHKKFPLLYPPVAGGPARRQTASLSVAAMKIFTVGVFALGALAATSASPTGAKASAESGKFIKNEKNEVLVTIDDSAITVGELEKTLASSPFGVQFNTMNRDTQASLRGMMLKRLVASRLLQAEAMAKGLENDPKLKRELVGFRKGLLYRHYMKELRQNVDLPEADLARLRTQYKDNPEAFTAARSASATERYRAMRVLAIQHLRDAYKVRVFEERIKPGMRADTILLQGANIGIAYGDLFEDKPPLKQPTAKWIRDQLYQQAEIELVADAAKGYKVNVEPQVKAFVKERLASFLSEKKEAEWVTGEAMLRAYYRKNPQIGDIPGRWHVGQIVLKDRKTAERLRKAIVAGASLFKMAGEYSIDPYGKSHNGDMGWVRHGSGYPAIEKAVKNLDLNGVSKVIETPKGFHIVTVLNKSEPKKRRFDQIKDKIRQAYIDQKMTKYLTQLQKKHKVVWKVLGQNGAKATGKKG